MIDKSRKIIIVFFATVTLILTVVLTCLYFKFVKKESNIVLLNKQNSSQQIYILGTIHEYHFNKSLGYSIAHIYNAIDNIKPNLILLEVDQNIYDEHNVIASPIEMIPIWCYAKENNIAVKGVDWFEVNENSRSWTTDKNRDDNIFNNIMDSVKEEQKILIILGSRHRIEQTTRFKNAGYKALKIPNVDKIFKVKNTGEFVYPKNTQHEVQKQINYWRTTAIDEVIKVTDSDSEGRKYWIKGFNKTSQLVQNILDEIIVKNKVYK